MLTQWIGQEANDLYTRNGAGILVLLSAFVNKQKV